MSIGLPQFGNTLPRVRLVQVVAETRPRVVSIAAPAGYGKTMLAGQIASLPRFGSAMWIDADGANLDERQLSSMVLASLGHVVPTIGQQAASLLPASMPANAPEAALKDACADLRGTATCVVVDNAGTVEPGCATSRLWALLSGAFAADVCLVTTSRSTLEPSGLDTETMLIQADDLRFSPEEAREYFRRVCGEGYEEQTLESCLAASRGHAALFAVLVRTAGIRCYAGCHSLEIGTEEFAGQLNLLARTQLNRAQQEALFAASLLGRGGPKDLELLLGVSVSAEDMRTISACIPLFQFADGRREAAPEFRIHETGREAFLSGLDSDHTVVMHAVRRLLEADRYVDAFELLRRFGDVEEVAEHLENQGAHLVDVGAVPLLRGLLSTVPTSTLVHRPALLLLFARALRILGDSREAIRRARLAAELAEHAGDSEVRLEALMLLGRMEMFEGNATRARRLFETVAGESTKCLSDDAQALLHSLLGVVSVHCGDFDAIDQQDSGGQAGPGQALGAVVVRYCEMLRSYSLFVGQGLYDRGVIACAAARRADSPIEVRIPSILNSARAVAFRGQLGRARAMLDSADAIIRSSGADVWLSSSITNRAIVAAGAGDYAEASELMSRIEQTAADEYDRHADLLCRSSWRRAEGESEAALTDSERAREFFLEFQHAPLLFEAGVESCANLLALGDEVLAAERATDLERRLAGTKAHGLLLRIHLVRGEYLRRNGQFDEATALLSRSREYLVSGNANWHAGMHLRAFPGMLSVLAAAVGAERIPVHLLRMLSETDATTALAAARMALSPPEYVALSSRLLGGPVVCGVMDGVDASPHCTVRLFGRLSVETSDGPVTDTDWRKRKARLLFAMLVVRKGKDVPREQLLEYLWPDMDGDRARANFYVIWNNMKRALSPNLAKGKRSPYVSANGGVCRVDDVLVSTDLDDFERCLADARRAESEGDYDRMLAEYRRLSEIYQGDLLPGDIYDDWFGPLRERCRQEFSDAMLAAGKMLAEGGDHAGALQLLRQALTYDPWREDLYQTALRCQITSGQRSAAIDTYMMCMHKLSEDLGLDPSTETKKLYDQVLAMEEPPAEGYAV